MKRAISGLVTIDDIPVIIGAFAGIEGEKTKSGQEWSINALGVDLLMVRGYYANRHEVYSDEWYLKFYVNHVHPVTRPFLTLDSPMWNSAVYDISFEGDIETFENNILLLRMM